MNDENEITPHFSYMVENVEVKSDNYKEVFNATGGILSVDMEVDGHKLSVMVNKYKGVGDNLPIYIIENFTKVEGNQATTIDEVEIKSEAIKKHWNR